MGKKKHRHSYGGRKIPVSPEVAAALQEQETAFKQKFGRPPSGDDPLFFDPRADTPKPTDEGEFTSEVAGAMRKAGISGALIYAFEKTGRLVTAENQKYLSARELAEWDAAIDEYEAGAAGCG